MAKAGAIKAGKAYVELFADNNKLIYGLKSAERKLTQFGNTVGMLGRKFLMVGAAMAAPFAISSRVFMRFEDEILAVKAVTGATVEEFKKLNQKAKELGRTTSYTAAEVAGAMAELGRGGFNPDEINKAIGAVLALGRATRTELAESAGIIINVLRAFDLNADQTTHVTDLLTAAVNNSAQTLTDLGESMKYVAPVAKEFGLSIADTVKSIGALANVGIKGSMAGTSLRNIMLRLVDPAVIAEFQRLGVGLKDAGGNFKNLAVILRDLGAATNKMKGPERLAILYKLFMKRSVAAGAKLTAKEFQNLIDAVDNAGGVAKKTAEIMDSGLGGAWRRFTSALEGIGIAIGESLKKPLEAVGKVITKVEGLFIVWIEKNQAIVNLTAAWVVGILAAGVALILLGVALKTLAFGFSVLLMPMRIFGALFAGAKILIAALISPLGIFIAMILAVGAAIIIGLGNSGKVIDWLKEKFHGLMSGALEAFSAIGAALAAGEIQLAANVLWTSLKLIWQKGTAALQKMWINIKFGMLKLWEDTVFGIQAAWAMLQNKLVTIGIDAVAALRSAWQTFIGWYKKAIHGTANWITKKWFQILGIFDKNIDMNIVNDQIKTASDAEMKKIDQERDAAKAGIEKQRQAMQAAQKEEYEGKLGGLVSGNAAAQKKFDDETAKQLEEAQTDVTAAYAEWQAAIKAAKGGRRQYSEGASPVDDALSKLKDALKGVGDFVSSKVDSISATGTFSSSRLGGFGGGAVERTAKATEETARHTKEMANNAKYGASNVYV